MLGRLKRPIGEICFVYIYNFFFFLIYLLSNADGSNVSPPPLVLSVFHKMVDLLSTVVLFTGLFFFVMNVNLTT